MKYQTDDAGGENEAKIYPPVKKLHHTKRINHKAKLRVSLVRELKGRRGSKRAREPSKARRSPGQDDSRQERKSQNKRQPRRLPVGELVLMSERLDEPSGRDTNYCR